jgi:hypothetical protein
VAEYLFPGGKVRGGEYHATNHVRGDRKAGSFSVNVATGEWNDFADAGGGGGDVVSLWAYRYGCKQGEAARALLDWLGGSPVAPLPAPRAPIPAPRAGPAPADVAAVWHGARRLWPEADADAGAVAWLEARGLDAGAVDVLGLARSVTRWPWEGKGAAERRLVARVWNDAGELVGLRGRLVAAVPDAPKETVPAGVAARGRVLACPLGVAMLRGEAEAGRRVVICEGTPDWLSVATLWGPDASSYRLNTAPAVLGIWSGSLTDAVLGRIPDGAVVTLCPHRDPSGVSYMKEAAIALRRRGCRLSGAAFDGDRDFNDTLQAGGNAWLWQRLDAAEEL